jgi:hypothetical protein
MPTRRRWKLKESFAHFGGAKATNRRWSWSAKSRDGKTVVVTMWKPDADRGILQSKARTRKNRLGFNDRLKNLIWARDHCGGLFRVVITVKKTNGKGKYWFPAEKLVMRIRYLDDETGAFRAESVGAQQPLP